MCWGKCVCADDQCCLWLAIRWVSYISERRGRATYTPSPSMATPTVDLGPPPIHDIISLHWYLSQYSCSRACPNFVTSHTHQPSTQFHVYQLENWHIKYIPSLPSNGRTTTALVPFEGHNNWAQCFPKIWNSTLNPSISTIISYTKTHVHHSMLNATAAITSKLIVVACPTLSHPFNRVILHNFRVFFLCPRRIW